MNDEVQYSRGVVMAAATWVATAALVFAAWAAWAVGGQEHIYIAILIAETACVLSAVAAVMHLRCYAARICRLIRTTSGDRYHHDGDGGVRTLPPRR